jgi:hypothetical protein
LGVFSRTNHLIAVPFKTPGRKPCPDHAGVGEDAGPASECVNSAGNSVGSEANPLGIIEIGGRVDDSANYSPLIARKTMLAHLLVDYAKTLSFDLTPG